MIATYSAKTDEKTTYQWRYDGDNQAAIEVLVYRVATGHSNKAYSRQRQ